MMAEDFGDVDLPIQIVEDFRTDVSGGRGQAIRVENRSQSQRWHAEIVHRAEQLDFLVADLGDVDDRTFQVSPGVVTKRVKLDANSLEPPRSRRSAGPCRRAAKLRSYRCDS